MPTIITFCVLAAVGWVLWWLLRDAFGPGRVAGGGKCPVCGGRRASRYGGRLRCLACGAEFTRRAGWHVREPTLAAVSLILLALIGLLAGALFEMALGWQIVGAPRAALIALAALGGIAASVCSFVKHRKQYGRN